MRRKLGEILIQEGLVSADEVEAALRAQVIYGGRLGTNLVELGSIDLDQLATALSKQYSVPPAHQADFDRVKPSTLALLPAKVVEKHSVIPLDLTERNPKTLTVVFTDPSRIEAIDEISFVTGMRVRPLVAPELRMVFYLEKFYEIRRRTRFIRVEAEASRPPPTPSSAATEVPTTLAVEVEVPLHQLRSGGLRSLPPPPGPRATGVSVVAARRDFAFPPDLAAFLDEVNLVATPPEVSRLSEEFLEPDEGEETILELLPGDEEQVQTALPSGPPLELPDAVAKISESESRNEIGDAIVDCLKNRFLCTLVLVVRHGVAFGWKGHGIADGEVLSSLAIPLNIPSFLKVAYDHQSLFRGPPPVDGAAAHAGLWQLLKIDEPVEILVAPVALRDRVVSLVVAVPKPDQLVSDDAMTALTTLAFSASSNFVRLIRRAKTAA